MKKLIGLLLASMVLAACGLTAQSNDEKNYDQLLQKVDEMRGKHMSSLDIARALFAGTGTAGIIGYGIYNQTPAIEMPEEKRVGWGAVAGIAAGAAQAGLILAAVKGYKWWQVRSINKTLKQYIDPDFYSLPQAEAAMVLSAYGKDDKNIKLLAPKVAGFLSKPGVVEALSDLYFGTGNPKKVPEMRSIIFPGK